jgi:hypothetical protein
VSGTLARAAACRPNPPALATAHAVAALIGWALAASAPPAHAQDIEPRAYSNVPIGVNFVIAGYAYTRGGVAFDPALPAFASRSRRSPIMCRFCNSLLS